MDIETVIRDKENELREVRSTMEHNEEVIVKVRALSKTSSYSELGLPGQGASLEGGTGLVANPSGRFRAWRERSSGSAGRLPAPNRIFLPKRRRSSRRKVRSPEKMFPAGEGTRPNQGRDGQAEAVSRMPETSCPGSKEH